MTRFLHEHPRDAELANLVADVWPHVQATILREFAEKISVLAKKTLSTERNRNQWRWRHEDYGTPRITHSVTGYPAAAKGRQVYQRLTVRRDGWCSPISLAMEANRALNRWYIGVHGPEDGSSAREMRRSLKDAFLAAHEEGESTHSWSWRTVVKGKAGDWPSIVPTLSAEDSDRLAQHFVEQFSRRCEIAIPIIDSARVHDVVPAYLPILRQQLRERLREPRLEGWGLAEDDSGGSRVERNRVRLCRRSHWSSSRRHFNGIWCQWWEADMRLRLGFECFREDEGEWKRAIEGCFPAGSTWSDGGDRARPTRYVFEVLSIPSDPLAVAEQMTRLARVVDNVEQR